MIFKNDWQKAQVVMLTIVSLYIIFYVLYIGASFIIPFVIAVLLSLAIISLSTFYKKLVRTSYISFPLSIVTYGAIFYLFWKIINTNIQDIIQLGPIYQQKILIMIADYSSRFWLDVNTSVEKVISYVNVSTIVSSIAWALTSIFKNAWIIIFYTIFILLEHRFFSEKLRLMVKNPIKQQKLFETLSHLKKDVRSYFLIKTLVSLVTAILSYCVLLIFWVDFALFWAFIIFILNYIPTIGSIIAVFFPVLFSFVQFDSFAIIWWLALCLASVQILMGNIIEPKIQWNRLNLSPLVILLALWFWWIIWWVVGMLLSVPIMVIINIVLSKFDITRPVAILLSEKWEVRWDFSVIDEWIQMLTKVKDKLWKKKK